MARTMDLEQLQVVSLTAKLIDTHIAVDGFDREEYSEHGRDIGST
jgi:hypothetical protein